MNRRAVLRAALATVAAYLSPISVTRAPRVLAEPVPCELPAGGFLIPEDVMREMLARWGGPPSIRW